MIALLFTYLIKPIKISKKVTYGVDFCRKGRILKYVFEICGERSSVGRASGCGSEGRGFDPHRSPQF